MEVTTMIDMDDPDDYDTDLESVHDLGPKKNAQSKEERESTRKRLSEHWDKRKLAKELDWTFDDIQ